MKPQNWTYLDFRKKVVFFSTYPNNNPQHMRGVVMANIPLHSHFVENYACRGVFEVSFKAFKKEAPKQLHFDGRNKYSIQYGSLSIDEGLFSMLLPYMVDYSTPVDVAFNCFMIEVEKLKTKIEVSRHADNVVSAFLELIQAAGNFQQQQPTKTKYRHEIRY